MIRILSVLLSLALLAGCGSGVKLDEVPVEDRTATPITMQPLQPAGTATPAGAVTRPATPQTDTAGRSPVANVDLTRPGTSTAVSTAPNVVYFDYDSYLVKPEFAAVIDGQAKLLKADRSRKVAIEGHTDERGGREYNLALGQRRAEAVRQALGLLGVPEAQVEAVSFGKEKPAVPGSSEAAMARNRRAEIVLR